MAWPYDKSHSFGFRLAHGSRCFGAPLDLVQNFVTQFVNQRGKDFCFRLAGEKSDLAAIAHAERGHDALVVLNLDPLPVNEPDKPVKIVVDFARNGRGLWKVGSCRLPIVEDMYNSKSGQYRLPLFLLFLVAFVLLLASIAEDRSENWNAFFAFLHKASKLVPGADACDVGCGRAGTDNTQDIGERIPPELCRRSEISSQCLALARFKWPDEMVYCLLDDELRRVIALSAALPVRRVAVAP